MTQSWHHGAGGAWPLALIIIGVNVLVFILQPGAGGSLLGTLALWPVGTPEYIFQNGSPMSVPDFMPWQLVTYGFLHGSPAHLFFNMLALFMFGMPLERGWGRRRFAISYFPCLIGAGLVQLVVASGSGTPYPTVGASGAVFGLLLAFGLMFPNQIIMLIFPPIPMKAKYFVLIFGGIELLLGVTGSMPGVAHFAHLGGMLFGFLLLYWWGWKRGRRYY